MVNGHRTSVKLKREPIKGAEIISLGSTDNGRLTTVMVRQMGDKRYRELDLDFE